MVQLGDLLRLHVSLLLQALGKFRFILQFFYQPVSVSVHLFDLILHLQVFLVKRLVLGNRLLFQLVVLCVGSLQLTQLELEGPELLSERVKLVKVLLLSLLHALKLSSQEVNLADSLLKLELDLLVLAFDLEPGEFNLFFLELAGFDDALQVLNLLHLHLHLSLDIVQVLQALLHLVALELEVFDRLALGLLGAHKGVILLLQLLHRALLVLVQCLYLRVLHRFELLQVDELQTLHFRLVFGLLQLHLHLPQFLQRPLMPDLELAVRVVHRIEFPFKLEPQLDFLFMVLRVLHVLLLELEPELLLVGTVFLQLVVVPAHGFHVLPHDFLVVDVALNLALEHFFDLVDLAVMLVRDLGNQNSVVRLAAVLEQDLVHFPDRRDDLVVFLRRREDLLQQLEEAD